MKKLRSREWFDNAAEPDMTALYLERQLNFGLTRGELQSGLPIIGIAQTGSDIAPCNRIHLALAQRVKEGVRAGSGMVIWQDRQFRAAGKIDDEAFMEMAAAPAPSAGHCNTTGTALNLISSGDERTNVARRRPPMRFRLQIGRSFLRLTLMLYSLSIFSNSYSTLLCDERCAQGRGVHSP